MVFSFHTKIVLTLLCSSLSLFSCSNEENQEGGKDFSHLKNPLVLQFKDKIDTIPTYIGVIDIETLKLFTIIEQPVLQGQSNTRAVYSPFSKSYYFFHSGSSFLYSIHEDGSLSDRIETWPYPGNILNTCTKDGYLIIGHSLGARGTRISIFDTKINRFIREKLFLPDQSIWDTAYYDTYSNSCFFSSTLSDENNNTSEVLYRLDLDTFSIKQVYISEDNTLIADMYIKNQIYIAAYNARDGHESHLIWLDLSSGEHIKHLDIHNKTGSFIITKVFSYDNAFYTLVEKKLNTDTEGTLHLYTYSHESDALIPVWNDSTITSFKWDDTIIQGNYLYFLTYTAPEIHIRALNLDSINMAEKKVFSPGDTF